jgi:hypothetical protein
VMSVITDITFPRTEHCEERSGVKDGVCRLRFSAARFGGVFGRAARRGSVGKGNQQAVRHLRDHIATEEVELHAGNDNRSNG